ncbi:hypothetical protein N7474_008592 [Penicillium riverlandense]|uniref:uncharacterized protein n=1 Tax=Penicillium riverlandense TaxID=1903569 RepID=UPI00254804B9|nr:uncharacterized protein N7474_008592 [Penicillium riverlandense]KAJ5812291.1 hypothetical protein N7474_008592 [Penicillium riverlandense]
MCQRCGAILEHPYIVNLKAIGKVQYHGTSTMQKHLKTAGCLKSEQGKRAEITKFLKKGEEDILQFITLNRLPLHLIEHPAFQRLISRARCAPLPPIIPSADTIRRRLGSIVKDRYFVDIDWVYREVLLRFKPLYGAYIGANLSNVLLETLTDHDLEAQVFGLTTDNASNNKTLFDSL